MKILALADVESKYLWEFYDKSKLESIDLIVSCGDLKGEYLSFLATLAHVPVLYVHGNHDGRYEIAPPEGCICIEDDIYVHEGVRILGLGGSMCYNCGSHQYTEHEMRKRVHRLYRKLRKHKGFDILVTHSPAYRFNDGDDLPHIGFAIFHELLEKYKPKFFIHGHMHMEYLRTQQSREREYNGYTTVVNAYERCELEY